MADRLKQLWNDRPGLCIALGAVAMVALFVALAPLGQWADSQPVSVNGPWPVEWGPLTLAFGLIRYTIKIAVYGMLAIVVMVVLRLVRGKPKPVEPPVAATQSAETTATDPPPETVPMSLGKLVTDLAYAVGKVEGGHRILSDRVDALEKAAAPKPRPARKRPAKKRGA